MVRRYKNSGIEWIGKIPEEWNCSILLRSLKGHITDGPHETPVLQDNGIPFISVDSLNESENVDLSVVKKFISKDLYNEYRKKANIEKGDILFSKAATIGKTAIVKDETFMVWSPLAILKPNPTISFGKYMYYVLNCEGLILHVSLLGTYNTQINVGMRALERAIIPMPPLSEQSRISDYLDEKCGDIDSLIALQEQMIEKLKAYKQSVITEAVTKGLNPNVKLVPSGIDWIGEIPNGWKVKPFKTLFRTGKGLSFTKADLVKEGLPVISYGQIHSKQNTGTSLNNELIRFVPDEIAKGGDSSKVKVGDFIFADTSEDLSGCGNCVYVDKEIGLYAGYHSVIAFSKRNLSNRYLAYLFLTDSWRSQIRCRVSGIKVFSISQSIINQTSVILPPDDVQLGIATFLDGKCSEIDKLIDLKQQKIEKLKEYKKSVIYEAVTGKIVIE